MKYSRLLKMKAMFSFDTNNVLPSCYYGLCLMAFDMFLNFKHIQSTIGVGWGEIRGNLFFAGIGKILFFHSLLIIALILFCTIILSVLRIRRRLIFFSAVSIYIFVFAGVRYPQLFHPLRINNFLSSDQTLFGLNFFILVCFILFCLMVFKSSKLMANNTNNYRKLRVYFVCASVTSLMILNCLTLGDETLPLFFSKRKQFAKTDKENIIVISIGALNADMDAYIYKFANKSLKNFLDRSNIIPKTIADSTQTHGSFVSIFSGKRPYQNSVGYQEKFETLKEIHEKNYRITFMRDDMLNVEYSPGTVIERLITPPGEAELEHLGNVYSSVIAFGIFDNVIGESISPSAYRGSASNFGNKPKQALKRFSEYLFSIEKSIKPEFLFFHSSILHRPLVLPYPYYPRQGKGQTEPKFNGELYRAGVRYLVEQLLNPIFESLENSGNLDNSKVFLISDRGENLWDQHEKLVPNFTIPFHDDTLLFGSKNEFVYFRVLNSSGDNQNQGLEINLSQGFRRALGLTFDQDIVYSENRYTSIISKNPDYFNSDDKIVEQAMIQKQKSVYGAGFKLTVYPTISGRKYFLCNYVDNELCTFNYFGHSNTMKTQEKLFKQLEIANDFDVKLGLDMPVSPQGESHLFEEVKSALNKENEWLRFRAAEVLYFRFHDFLSANKEISFLFKNSENANLKRLIAKTHLRRCYYANQDLKQHLQMISEYLEAQLKYPDEYLWRFKFTECISTSFDFALRTADVNSSAWRFNSVNALKESFNLPEAVTYLNELKNKYNLPDSKSISSIFEKIPSGQQKNEASKFINYLKVRLSYFFEYDLAEGQVPYYMIKFILLKAVKMDVDNEILQDISTHPTGIEFELRFISYLEKKYKLAALQQDGSVENVRKARLNRVKIAIEESVK